MIIDDFNTGPYRRSLISGEEHRDTQSGTGILGPGGSSEGLRNTWIGFITSPFGTPVTIDVGTGGLIITTGPNARHSLALFYGWRDWTIETPLHLDLSPFRGLRLRFGANDLPLAFNIYLSTETSTGSSRLFWWANNINIPSGDVEIPLVGMASVGGVEPPATAGDLSNVKSIYMLFNSALFGSNDYVIQSFEAI